MLKRMLLSLFAMIAMWAWLGAALAASEEVAAVAVAEVA